MSYSEDILYCTYECGLSIPGDESRTYRTFNFVLIGCVLPIFVIIGCTGSVISGMAS